MILRHLRNNLVGYVALLVALSGTSYAVTRIDANSVGTRQIKDGAVTSVKIRNGTVVKADLKPGVLPVRYAMVSHLTEGSWPASPDVHGLELSFTTPVAGPAVVRYTSSSFSVSCSAGSGLVAIEIDGQAVPGAIATAGEPDLSMVGAVTLTKGEHTIGIAMDCPSGDVTGMSRSDDSSFELYGVGSLVTPIGLN